MRKHKGNFKIRIQKLNAGLVGPRVYLADGATLDGAWFTDQDRHPEERVKSWKRRVNAEKRAEELRANGIECVVEVIY